MRKRYGFTLVEVLVVMVVIGILIALIVPNALQAIQIAEVRACANNIRTLDSAIQLFFAQNRVWPNTMGQLCPFLAPGACVGGTVNMPCGANPNLPAYQFLPDANGNNSSIDRTVHFATFPNIHN